MKPQLLNAYLLFDSQLFAEHKQFRVADFIELPAPSDQEIDIEGLTYAGHYLWFVGSTVGSAKPNPIKLMKKIFRD